MIQLLRNQPVDAVLPNLSQIAPNQAALQTVSCDLPPAWDYLEEGLLMTGVVPANIQELRFMPNGSPFIRVPGTELDAGFNQYFGAPAFGADAGAGATNLLTLFLRRLGIQSGSKFGNGGVLTELNLAKDLAYATSVNAGIVDSKGQGIRNLRLEIDLINTPNVPCSIQVLGRVLPQDPNVGGAGLVPRIDRQSLTVSSGQQVNLARPMLQYGDPLHQFLFGIMLVPAVGMTLDNFILRYNGYETLKRSAANNAWIQSADRKRFPQGGYYWVDLTERGYGDELLPIGSDGTGLQLQFTPDQDGAISIYQYGAGALA